MTEDRFPEKTILDPAIETATPDEYLLAIINAVDIDALCGTDALRMDIAIRRLQAALEYKHRQVVGRLEKTQPKYAKHELALAHKLSDRGADAMLYDAETITRLPRLAALMRDGDLDPYRFDVCCDSVSGLFPEQVAQMEDALLPLALDNTAQWLRRRAKKIRLRIDPQGAEERRHDAHTRRTVSITPQEDGMSTLWALISAIDAQRISDSLTRDAKQLRQNGDERTLDMLRADLLVDRLLGVGPGTRPVEAKVIISAETLLKLNENPAYLDGYGDIDSELGRALTAEGQWRVFYTDQNGELTGMSAKRYRPGKAKCEFVKLRDLTCRFPNCTARATCCDVDHILAWPDGTTTVINLHTLCRRHHRLKHERGYQVRRDPDGTTHWETPLGRHYLVKPEPLPGFNDPPTAKPEPPPEKPDTSEEPPPF